MEGRAQVARPVGRLDPGLAQLLLPPAEAGHGHDRRAGGGNRRVAEPGAQQETVGEGEVMGGDQFATPSSSKSSNECRAPAYEKRLGLSSNRRAEWASSTTGP